MLGREVNPPSDADGREMFDKFRNQRPVETAEPTRGASICVRERYDIRESISGVSERRFRSRYSTDFALRPRVGHVYSSTSILRLSEETDGLEHCR
jgi:hypothetical protein